MRVILPALLLLSAGSLVAQTPLPVGARTTGSAGAESPARFSFTPDGAGILTITVQSDEDVGIAVVDVDGQMLPGGSADIDAAGKPGLEYLAVPVTLAEPLFVDIVMVSGGEGSFTISAGFIPEPAFALPADPDRRPGLATVVTVGENLVETLDPIGGDRLDWYTITVTEAGSLVFVTRLDGNEADGDIALEAFLNGDLTMAAAQSDQDLQDSAGNESVTIMVKPGDRVDLKVAALFDDAVGFGYRLSVARVP